MKMYPSYILFLVL